MNSYFFRRDNLRILQIMKNITLYITILLNLLITTSKAEITEDLFDIQHLNTRDGLRSQRVFSIIEDNHGAIWIATKDGIDRYNGNSIKNYNLRGQFYYGDMAGRILRLFYDENYGLWGYDQTGKIFRYSERDDAFTQVFVLDQMIDGPITLNKFHIDNQGVCWFGTHKGAYAKRSGDTIRCVLPDIYVTDIIAVRNDIAIATSEGVYKLHASYHTNILPQTSDLYAQTLYYDDKRNELWVGTFNDGLGVLDMNNNKWSAVKYTDENKNPIRSITTYDEHTLLVGIDGGGVYTINKDNHHAQRLMGNNDNMSKTRLQGNGIYTVFKDSQGNIWTGSYTGGVSVAILLHTPTSVLTHEFSNIHSLANNNVNDIEENIDGNLWYSTDSGISICNIKTGEWTHILNDIVVTTLCRGNDGVMWAGTYGKGVYKLNKYGKIIKHLTVQTKELTTNYTLSIHFDRNNELWVGGLGGKLVRINNTDKSRNLYNIDWVQDRKSVV